MPAARKPLVLMILDGWGYRAASEDNAIAQAKTPCWDRLWQQDPHTLIDTSGAAVGLPDGQMGNSEVGHMNMGAGRIVYQDFTRITKSIHDGSFQHNEVICTALDATMTADATLHIMGLLSPGGVHSHEQHFMAAVELAANRGLQKIAAHVFLDGRDTPPRSAESSIRLMQNLVDRIEGASISTVCGRYFSMDRDQRWDRIRKAYDAIALGQAEHRAGTALEALSAAYERGENDEFVQPTIVADAHGVADGDSIFFINFRADRARELSIAFVAEDFLGFDRRRIKLSAFVCMTEYLADLPVTIAFPSASLPQLLPEILAAHGLRQLRIAETEKYAHVTFFFNGGRETPFAGEERKIIPSPKEVATYDEKPEMSAYELTEATLQRIAEADDDFILINFANPDMVGHTGSLAAAIKAVETVDECAAKLVDAVVNKGGVAIVTADHGNCERMIELSTGAAHTYHTTNPVSLFVIGDGYYLLRPRGRLADVAPTVLDLLGLEKPVEMTGTTLIDTWVQAKQLRSE